jgi:antirestriction protein ArdC
MTYKQCVDKGGHVIKGSKSTPVIFWKWLEPREADATDTDTGKIPMLRFYNVFNLEPTEGITAPEATEAINTFTPIERAEQIITGMPLRPEIKHGGNRASYSPMLDYIKLPEPKSFSLPEEYYNTAFHELAHSTGHESRVGRKGVTETSYFGSHEYSKEELVAEMSASFLSAHAGIENT